MQAAVGGAPMQTNPYMSAPAMTPQVMPATQAAAAVVSPARSPSLAGLEMGGDPASMAQTTPGGFNAASIPGVGNGELDSILNAGAPTAPANPAANMSLDDVLTGIMA